MKPAPFEYRRPGSLAEAVALLADQSRIVKPLAGGQSLVPMLNLRLAPIDLAVDISRLSELRGISLERQILRLGACVTHAEIEDAQPLSASMRLLRAVAGGIANRAIRNRGTVGGSVALADPATEWPSTLLALDAVAHLRGPAGVRSVPLREFFLGAYTTALMQDELLEAITLPARSASFKAGFEKICRKAGEFASSLAFVAIDPSAGYARVVLGGTGGAPLVLERVGALARTDSATDAAAVRAAAQEDFAASGRQFDDYERQIHSVSVARALKKAIA
jgi:carbon-monoxide dehydrogenase medium subunit